MYVYVYVCVHVVYLRAYVLVSYILMCLFHFKIATDCNENIRRLENELKLFSITKRFPNDEVEVVSARWIKTGKNGESLHQNVCVRGGWWCVEVVSARWIKGRNDEST